MESGVLSIKMTHQLKKRSKHLDPYRIKVQLEAAQADACRACRSVGFLREASRRVTVAVSFLTPGFDAERARL